MEQLNKSIEARLQVLKFTNAQTSGAVERQDYASVERLRNTLARNVAEIHNPKVRVQELRFEAEQEEGETLIWNTDLETKLGVFGKSIDDLDVKIKNLRTAANGARVPYLWHKRVRPSQDGQYAQDQKTRETHCRNNALRMDHDVTWKRANSYQLVPNKSSFTIKSRSSS